MKKLLYACLLLVTVCACNRMRVRHDHKSQMPAMRLAVDTAQRNDVAQAMRDSMGISDDEELFVTPQEPVEDSSPASAGDDVERLMRGEDVEF